MKFEVIAPTHVKYASIFCGTGSENQNHFSILQNHLALFV